MNRTWIPIMILAFGASCDPSASPDKPTPIAPTGRYPETPRGQEADTLFGVRVEDPYRWLEDAKDPKVQAWMTAQDDLTRKRLASAPGRDSVVARLKELSYAERVWPPEHEGNRWFVSRRDKGREKASVFMRDSEDGPDTLLFDPEAMSPDGSISLHGYWPNQDASLVAYKLSKNNADASDIHVRDLASGQDLPDIVEGARYAQPSWSPDGKGFYYTWVPTDPAIPLDEIPAKKEIRFHLLGTDPARDEIIIPAQGDPQLFFGVDVSRNGHWLMLVAWHGWNRSEVWVRDLRVKGDAAPALSTTSTDAAPFARAGFSLLAGGSDALFNVSEHADRFVISTNDGAPHWRVFVAEAAKLSRADWKEIIPERADAVIESVRIVGGLLSVQYLLDVHSVVELRDFDGKLVREVPLPGLGSSDGLVGRSDEDVAYLSFDSFVDPPRIFRVSVKDGSTTLWHAANIPVDSSRMAVEQVFYPSKDGTKIPMFLVHAKDWKRDGNNPVLLNGYGGFNSTSTPRFWSQVVPWVEHGGVFAMANLRGGGEYGETWHRAGMLDKKQNVFDDFIAAAEWLAAEKISSPDRIAIEGASNGGLLVGATMVQRPDVVRAVVCGVPLLDMVRYSRFGSGATWMGEYGDPSDEKAFKWLHAYSPYHHVVPGTRYPSLLMQSADSDDRVDPMHARKFIAAIQHASPNTGDDRPALLRIERNAGHGGGDQVKQWIDQVADEYAFLFAELGMK